MGMPSEVRSGTGIARKQMMSNLIVLPVQNNLRRTRLMLAKLSFAYMKQYMTEEMAFQITDDPRVVRTVQMSQGAIQALKERTYDIVITEMKDYAVLREQQAEMLLTVLPQLAALGPGMVKLGIPGLIHGVNIDTSFFTGNYPEYASIEVTDCSSSELKDLEKSKWEEVLEKSELFGGSKNYFHLKHPKRVTHLRLRIYPDGGVARLRVHGEAAPSAEELAGVVNVAAATLGAKVISANDAYFGPKDNLIFPGRAQHMGEGWETRRKRGPGFDWIILKLAGFRHQGGI
jgi:hypothetical protein